MPVPRPMQCKHAPATAGVTFFQSFHLLAASGVVESEHIPVPSGVSFFPICKCRKPVSANALRELLRQHSRGLVAFLEWIDCGIPSIAALTLVSPHCGRGGRPRHTDWDLLRKARTGTCRGCLLRVPAACE